ncbi:MAG: molybdopterin-dependent oxidoreductase [Desulfobacterales bacterium]|jgi:nitrate reductase NapA|nr:periplasmic nitrate reductase subunit alpha [Desulfobacter sp.]MDP6681954.1 molybdopterin-dependent oxidoreductase [Desulfobacterales bacterium]MDP6808270.1 molybdopterin-dependent oxidoreductase [Desulfobacterales bacterium]|tara:strand:- start:29468 stop:31783 length:2316 start_codon:yes stop_codon:yes gene_type:complete
MDISRREFIKLVAAQSAAATAGVLFPGISFGAWEKLDLSSGRIKWKKTPCRFCGTGCGLLVGVAGGRAVAVKGDPNCSVNKGLCCVKGYHSIQVLYGKDRVTEALVRKNDKLVEVPLKEALDLVAAKMKETIKDHGKDAVAIYGSGQWSIPDGYVASKLFKGCIGTNNVEANARLCMASAVTGFLTSFGLDEPMGCYDDIDHADVFITWGNNMAEMHPVLFSRMLANRKSKGHIKIIDFATRTTRSSQASDKSILFRPQTDLAVANAICYEIIHNKWVNWDFVNKHVSFHKGKTNIGYGIEDHFKFKDKAETVDFEQFKAFLKDYTPEKVEKISGVSAQDIKYLAALYGNPDKKVTSFWCMGPNQHTRGTWINNLIYNIHLLVGKISTPGNSPFSLTGQPSACGTVREVGTLTHKLPHGVVMKEKARQLAAKIWNVPVTNIDPKPTYHTVEMFRALDRGDIRLMWIQATNPMVTMPNLNRYRDGAQKEDRFVVVSEIYPTPTYDIADVVLPSALWIEREGFFGNSERRTQHNEQLTPTPGNTMCNSWQLIEVARRLGYEKQFPWGRETHIEDIWNEYIQFHDNPKHRMAPYKVLQARSGVQWPFVNGMETKWRFNPKYDPAAKGEGFDFYGKPDHRAWIWLRPYEPAAESPDSEYPFWLNTGRVLEHWHSGSMTRRIPILHRAVPSSYVEINADDAARLGIVNGSKVKISSRRGSVKMPASINGRGIPPKGMVFVPFFDEKHLINEVTLDAFCPISKQPDYKKCAVKVERG